MNFEFTFAHRTVVFSLMRIDYWDDYKIAAWFLLENVMINEKCMTCFFLSLFFFNISL